MTGTARPGSVLCTEAIHDAAREQFMWSFAGRHRLKGVADSLPLHRARRLPDEAPRPGDPPEKSAISDHKHSRERKPGRRGKPPRRR